MYNLEIISLMINMFLAHAPLSYLGNEIIQRKSIKQLKSHEQILVALFSFFFGILPDFDIFLLTFFRIPTFLHHEIISHTPIFYISIWILLRLIAKPFSRILNKKTEGVLHFDLLNILINTFLISTLLHIFADVLTSDIILFYPFSEARISVFKYIFEPSLFGGYSLSPLFALELIIIGIFLIFAYKKYLTKNIVIDLITRIFLVFSCIYLLISVYINLNTYNSSYLYDKNGKTNYDVDYDSVLDSNDSQIGRNSAENILNTSSSEVFDSAINIVNSGKWTGKSNGSFTERIKYSFGGMNSFRIISQAYYDLHLPIEPALRSYYVEKNNITEYSVDIPYPETLMGYFLEKNLLLEVSLDAIPNLPRGRTIFFLGENDSILNVGITLESNYIATVLDTDEKLNMHSYTEIRDTYKNIKKIYILK